MQSLLADQLLRHSDCKRCVYPCARQQLLHREGEVIASRPYLPESLRDSNRAPLALKFGTLTGRTVKNDCSILVFPSIIRMCQGKIKISSGSFLYKQIRISSYREKAMKYGISEDYNNSTPSLNLRLPNPKKEGELQVVLVYVIHPSYILYYTHITVAEQRIKHKHLARIPFFQVLFFLCVERENLIFPPRTLIPTRLVCAHVFLLLLLLRFLKQFPKKYQRGDF